MRTQSCTRTGHERATCRRHEKNVAPQHAGNPAQRLRSAQSVAGGTRHVQCRTDGQARVVHSGAHIQNQRLRCKPTGAQARDPRRRGPKEKSHPRRESRELHELPSNADRRFTEIHAEHMAAGLQEPRHSNGRVAAERPARGSARRDVTSRAARPHQQQQQQQPQQPLAGEAGVDTFGVAHAKEGMRSKSLRHTHPSSKTRASGPSALTAASR
jgi:hypothetical protein